MQSAAQTKAQRDSLLALLLVWITFGEKAPGLKPPIRLTATNRLVRESEALVKWCINSAPNDPLPQSDLYMVHSALMGLEKPRRPRRLTVEEPA